MKSAYELTMERLEKKQQTRVLTAEQKERIADAESRLKAKTAEIEILMNGELAAAQAAGQAEELVRLQAEKNRRLQKVRDEIEAEKDAIRGAP